MAGKIMTDLAIRLTAQTAELVKGLEQANKNLKSFQNSVDNISKRLAERFFGIEAIMQSVKGAFDFSKESLKFAADAEGIFTAFNKIGNPTLLRQLRQATMGVFNDKQLAEYASKASSLGIAMKDLVTLGAYALNYSLRSGKPAVEVLDNAILAVGRGASKGLVQIGIATETFDKAYEKIGNKSKAIISVMENDLKTYGDTAATTATKLGQLNTSFENLKLAWGNFLANSKGVGSVLQWIKDELDIFSDTRLSFWEKMLGSPNEYKEFLKQFEWIKNLSDEDLVFNIELRTNKQSVFFASKLAGEDPRILQELWRESASRGIDGAGAGGSTKEIETLSTLNTKLQIEINALQNLDIADKEAIASKVALIKEYKAKIKVIEDLLAMNEKEIKQEKEKILLYNQGLEAWRKMAEDQKRSQEALAESMRNMGSSSYKRLFMNSWGIPTKADLDEYGLSAADFEAIRQQVVDMMKGTNAPTEVIADQLHKNAVKIGQQLKDMSQMMQDGITDVVASFFEGLGRLSAGMNKVEFGAGLFNALSRFLIQLGTYMVSISPFIEGIKASLMTLNGPMLLASGIGLITMGGALAGAATNMLDKEMNRKKLANGGIAYGSVLANVGEYANANSNPEVIAPLSKLQSLLGANAMGSTVKFVVKGEDLVGVLNNNSRYVKSYR